MTYFTQITQYGINLVNSHISSGQSIIANDWYIALGTGVLTPSLQTTSLATQIYDKNSANYPGITIGTDLTLGRYAELLIPATLSGVIITEIGLYDGNDKLVASASTKIDLSTGIDDGIINSFKAQLSLLAIPDNVSIVYVNQANYATIADIEEHFVKQNGSTPLYAEQIGVNATSAKGLTTLEQVQALINNENPDIISLGSMSTNFTLTANREHEANIIDSCEMLKPTVAASSKRTWCYIELTLATGKSLTVNNVKWDWDFIPTLSTTNVNCIMLRTKGDGSIWRGSYKQGGS